MIENLTKDKFLSDVFDYERKDEWEYQGQLPCVIDFYDESCPPCRIIRPIIEELCLEYRDRVRFYEVNTAKESFLARDMGIKNLPTIVLCPKGEKPVVFQGAAPKDKLRLAIEWELLREVPPSAPNSD
jgi:thioredoxin 1